MDRRDWASWEEADTVKRRAAGRRRYNALRRQRVQERRAAIAAWFEKNPVAWLFCRGVPVALAPTFGVHPSTIWRDLQALLYPPRQCDFWCNGVLQYTVYRDYPGGPVVSLTDADGNEIRGQRRWAILRRLPRYCRRRR